VALDGKMSRRARRGQDHPLHVVSVWAMRYRLMLGQQAVGGKSREIIAIPLLLERMQLISALIMINAMGWQTKIAQAMLNRVADYLSALKDNQPGVAREVALFFAAPDQTAAKPFEIVDADHGRIETRRHWVSHDAVWLTTDRRFQVKPRFAGLKAIAMVEATFERGATSRAPWPSMTSRWRAPHGRTGASKIASVGCSTSSSTTTSCACLPSTDQISSATQRQRTAWRRAEKPLVGTRTISRRSSIEPPSDLQAIALRCPPVTPRDWADRRGGP